MRHPTTSAVVCSGCAAHFGALQAEAAEEPFCTCLLDLSVVWLAWWPPTITTTCHLGGVGSQDGDARHVGITVCIRPGQSQSVGPS